VIKILGGLMKVTPGTLSGIPFSKCNITCRAIKWLGVSECEALCPEKFVKFNRHPNQKVADLCSCSNPIECDSEWDWDRCGTCGKLIHEQD
jgi:hypothetical protein